MAKKKTKNKNIMAKVLVWIMLITMVGSMLASLIIYLV